MLGMLLAWFFVLFGFIVIGAAIYVAPEGGGGILVVIYIIIVLVLMDNNAFDSRTDMQVYESAKEKCKYLEGELKKSNSFASQYKCTVPGGITMAVE